MEVISVVVGVRMPVPAAFPRAIRAVFLIVNVEVVIPIPPNLDSSRYLARIVLTRRFDAEIQVSFLSKLPRPEGRGIQRGLPF